MRTLEQVKKDKNYLAHKKGYPIDPEGFSYKFLIDRFYDELGELQKVIESTDTLLDKTRHDIIYIESQFYCNDRIMDKLGDLSNIIDYIASKIITGYPTKYKPVFQRHFDNE